MVNHEKVLNPYMSAVLILPTLHALGMPTITMGTGGPSANQTLAAQLMACLKEAIERGRHLKVPKVWPQFVYLLNYISF